MACLSCAREGRRQAVLCPHDVPDDARARLKSKMEVAAIRLATELAQIDAQANARQPRRLHRRRTAKAESWPTREDVKGRTE